MPQFPKKSWVNPGPPVLQIDEASLQTYLDERLEWLHWDSYRFSDAFLAWMKNRAPAHIAKYFFSKWAGRPDVRFAIPLVDGYELLCPIELKSTKGRLHGKQKWAAVAEEWNIARTPEEVDAVLTKALLFTQTLLKLYKDHLKKGTDNERSMAVSDVVRCCDDTVVRGGEGVSENQKEISDSQQKVRVEDDGGQ